jgi:Rps23 Pro-64 3,4-dihydroxylase Tpa1-like proline 4-hydroxylase
LNYWDKFGPTIYKLFQYLNSNSFIINLEKLTGFTLFPDFGLNGGGLHTHCKGGKSNVHLDYALHPKLKLERKLNLIIYVSPIWNENWGGCLDLYTQKKEKKSPDKLAKRILPKFNRAIIFNTSQNSWHGLPDPILCPDDKFRNSLAAYFLTAPSIEAEERYKALFAPHGEQINDPEITKLIEKRSQVFSASEVYGDKS